MGADAPSARRGEIAGRARSLSAIVHEAVRVPSHRGAGTNATIVFDAGGELAWTVRLARGHVKIAPGRASRPSLTIVADPATLGAVLTGNESGVAAYLAGRLRARGSLALALELDALFEHAPRPPDFPRSRRRTIGGIESFYLEAGQPQPGRSPIVLVHGLGATCSSMLPTLHHFARDHHVYAVDLPGFGESEKPLRRYHAAFFAQWMLAFLDAVGAPRAHVVGNSMGGRVAIETALRHPERVDKIALFAPSMAFRRFRQLVPIARFLAPELGVVPLPITRLQVLITLRSLFAHSERVPRPWFDAAADEALRVFATPRGRIAFFSAAKQIYLEDAVGERGFWERLPRLSRPALFLFGDRDLLVPHAFSAHVRAAVPHAHVHVIPDCGHVPQFELPDVTHRMVRDFFDTA
jgi:pimeloyl-ACP methyl ester carboxylesterase/putative sterol carrier protein